MFLSLKRICSVSRLNRLAFADGARHPDVGEEVHFEAIRRAVSLARLASAAGLVEAESAWFVATHFRFGHLARTEAANLDRKP